MAVCSNIIDIISYHLFLLPFPVCDRRSVVWREDVAEKACVKLERTQQFRDYFNSQKSCPPLLILSIETSSFALLIPCLSHLPGQPKWGRHLLSCPSSARSFQMWYGYIISLLLLLGIARWKLDDASNSWWVPRCFVLNPGSLPSGGNHHTRRCDTWEGPHTHCGLFRYSMIFVFAFAVSD